MIFTPGEPVTVRKKVFADRKQPDGTIKKKAPTLRTGIFHKYSDTPGRAWVLIDTIEKNGKPMSFKTEDIFKIGGAA